MKGGRTPGATLRGRPRLIEMGDLLVFLVFLLAVPASIVLVVRAVRAARRRKEAYRAMAEALGWTFTEREDGLAASFPSLPLFQGSNRPSTNVLRGDFGSLPATVFEHTRGQGKSAVTQTVVHLRDARATLPAFEVRPEIKFADGVFKAFGYQDIELPHRPEFTRRFVLRGPEESAIRALFTDALVDAIETSSGVCVQAAGPDLVVFRTGDVAAPESIPELLTLANELLSVLSRTSGAGVGGATDRARQAAT